MTKHYIFGYIEIRITKKFMSNKGKRKNNSKLVFNCIMGTAIGFSLLASVYGALTISGLDLSLDNNKLKCDTKDYSSYIKTSRVETPGNDEINNQIETIKRAMENARNANDVSAFGQLYEKYTELLRTQSQTSTVKEIKDYSAADKAKASCYSIAENQKESDFRKSMWVLSCGAVSTVVFAIILAYKNIKKPSNKSTKKR